MKTSKPGKGVRLTAYALFFFLILTAVVLGLELYFRTQPAYAKAGYSYDPSLIFRLTPDLVGEKPHAWGKTGFPPYILRFNNAGFRGKDIQPAKAPGIAGRYLVLGDSYTAGLDFPDDLIFTAQWAAMLNAGDKKYEVVNASCPSWGTDQQYLYWKKEGIRLQPDKVVILFCPNDLREMWNHNLIRPDPQTGDIHIKKARLPFKERIGWKLASRSSFFQYLQQKVFHSDYGNFFRIFHFYPVNYGVNDSTDWDMPMYLQNPFPAIDDSYRLLEQLLVDMKSDCEKIGAELHLVKIPIRVEVDSTYVRPGLSPLMVEEKLEALARRNHIRFHNLNNRLREQTDPKGIFMDWEYHYDQDGHDWVAKSLFEIIKPD